MTDFAAPAQEVFQLLQSFDYTVMLYGADGNRVEDPSEARRLFARPENLLVSLIDDGDNSCIRLYIGSNTNINDILGLLISLRTAAPKYNLLFNVRQYGREIQPKDFAGEAITEARRKSKMEVFEGMYGTSRSSYLKLENARMIVRHSNKVDETKVGARSRCVESIFVENASGERMLFPTNNLAPARAMTQHVNLGGGFADLVGQQIVRMAQDFSNLGTCASYVNNNISVLPESAGAIREQCRTKMREMKKTFERMYRSENGYMIEAKKLEDSAKMLNEDDAENKVPPEKIEELKKTLNLENSSFLADSVFESVCKACMGSDINEEQPIVEEEVKTVSVLGRAVDEKAWNELKNGKIDLMGKPQVAGAGEAEAPGYTNKSGELVHKLMTIVPLVKNDSLMNLLSFVADRMPEERDPTIAKKMRTLALFVVKASGMSMNEGISENSKAIHDLSKWFRKFDPVVALREGWDKNPEENWDQGAEDALEEADHDFEVSDFLSSEAGKDLLSDHVKHDEEDEMTVSEIKHALEKYFDHWIDVHHSKVVDDLGWLADKKMSEVIAHLARAGYKVSGEDHEDYEANDEEIVDEDDFSDADHGAGMGGTRQLLDDDWEEADECDTMGGGMGLGEDMDEYGEDGYGEGDLTREDVLLPHPDEGESLAREVTPRIVKDPDTGDNTQPDSAYISRLRALSGMTAPNRQF